MKKIFILFATVIFGMSVQAQSLWDSSKPDHNFTFGVRGGINFASSDEDEATSSKTGFHIGAIVDYNIIKSFSISSGVYFTSKGFKGNYPEIPLADVSKATASKVTANYIQIPLLASFRIVAPSGVQFHINVGPYYAYGISGKAVYKPYDMTFDRSYDQDTFGNEGFWKHNDFGLNAGVNVLIGKFVAGFSYDYGFADVSKVYGKFHNRNANITIGFNF